MSGFRFERLDAWHKAIELCDQIYSVTRSFPTDERFGLTNQLRRAAVSVASNIAEGTSRSSGRDQTRFIEIAYGSVLEIVSQLHIAKRQGFLADEEHQKLYQLSDDAARMLSGLKATFERRQKLD